MTKLGEAVLLAARDQGWAVTVSDEWVVMTPPDVRVMFAIPVEMFDVDGELMLRAVLLELVVEGGLAWPWPPDHRDDVHGEVPREG